MCWAAVQRWQDISCCASIPRTQRSLPPVPSVLPMVVSLIGVCALRLVWIATIFQLNRTPFMLYISYPISWALTALVHLTCLLVVRRKLRQKQPQTV